MRTCWQQAEAVYRAIATAIETRSDAYIRAYSERVPRVGVHLFDRDRQPLVSGPRGKELLLQFGVATPQSPTRSESSP